MSRPQSQQVVKQKNKIVKGKKDILSQADEIKNKKNI